MAPVWADWTMGRPVPSPVNGCKGVCITRFRAPAVDSTGCQSEPGQPMNYTVIRTSGANDLPYSCQFTYARRCMLLEVQVQAADTGLSETIDVNVGRYVVPPKEQHTDCAGDYTWTTCSYRSAIAEYEVTTYNDTYVNIDFAQPRLLDVATNTARGNHRVNSVLNTTVAGIALLASMDLYTSIGMWFPNEPESRPYTDNVNTWQASLMSNTDAFHSRADCAPKWKDPLHDIEATLNELMFRTAVQAARDMPFTELSANIDHGQTVEQTVLGTGIDAQAVFQTRWSYFWAAAAVQIVCVFLVLITYRGYWLLGRSMSLGPLEIAQAFDAPALSNLTRPWSPALTSDLGKTRVKYEVAPGNDDQQSQGNSYRYRFVLDRAEV